MTNDVESLISKFPGREEQIKLLLSRIPSSKDESKSPSFVLDGPPSTGKSTVLVDVLIFRKQSYVLVDCFECFDVTSFYSIILERLFGGYEDYVPAPVDSFYAFFTAYKRALRILKISQHPVQYIVFKHFDNLKEPVSEDLQFLEEKCSMIWGFCSIFIVTGETPFALSRHANIHFPRYTKEQLRQILLSQNLVDSNVYTSFLQIFLPWILEKERNLRDLSRLADLLFPIYKKPIDEGKISLNDPQLLFKHIEPYLKKNADPTNLLCFNRIQFENKEDTSESFNKIDLPYFTKYLLLAAYLASYIPSKEDRMLFCRRALKKKKSRKKPRSSDNEVNLLIGPKPFPLNRLLAIYFSIVEERSNITVTLLSQIASLTELKLLKICGKEDDIDQPQYKCVATSNLVHSVAKTVKFDLDKFFC